MYADGLIQPFYDQVRSDHPRIDILDFHTHIGQNDPDGYRCTLEENLAALELAGARGVVFPMHEPDGYRDANDEILAAAEGSDGRLTPFCRLNPHDDPVAEAERCFERGARGIKLHPRAEQFALVDAPDIFAVANERTAPVLIHAGRGIPALGEQTLVLAERYPAARIVLAHVGISDLSWMWRRLDDHPNVFFDTAWWSTVDMLALLASVPPGRVLFASDLPYGTPVINTIMTMRAALQVGLDDDQLGSLMGRQGERLLAGDEPLETGPPPGTGNVDSDILLERASVYLVNGLGRMMEGGTGDEALALTRLACDVSEEEPHYDACRAILHLLELHDELAARRGGKWATFADFHLIALATCIARTPDVPVPASTLER